MGTPDPNFMAMSGAELGLKWWRDAWSEGLWAASWKRSLEGLTASQASWAPAPGRHSIWQTVLHMIFWREAWLRREKTGERTTPEERERLNWPEIVDASEAAWARARERFEETQRQIEARLASGAQSAGPMLYFLPHDCYHFGQINANRAMLGLPAIE